MTRPGRPLKENADYFSHDADASNDEKVVYLESIFGHTGYALYFKLIEFMTRSDNFEIEINEIKAAVYAKIFNVDVDIFNSFICESTRKEIRAFVVKDGILYSPGLKKRMQFLIDRRTYKREKYEKNEFRTDKNEFRTDKNAISHGQNTQSKVKESKVKESKEKKREKVFFARPDLSEVEEYFQQKKYLSNFKIFFTTNEANGWKTSTGANIENWQKWADSFEEIFQERKKHKLEISDEEMERIKFAGMM